MFPQAPKLIFGPERRYVSYYSTPAIRQVNKEIEAILKEDTGEHGRKRKPYKKISDELRAKVGKHAAKQGNPAAVRKFTLEFENAVKVWCDH